MKTMKQFFSVPLMALLLAACGDNKNAATTHSTAASSQSKPIVHVGLEPTYPPFVQQLPQGNFEGFDVMLLNEIAKRQGFTVNYSPFLWSGIFDRLRTGEVDVVIGGVSITPERQEMVDFTDSYYSSNVVFMVKEDAPWQTVEQLNGKNIVYQVNTVSAEALSKLQNGELNEKMGEDSVWQVTQRIMATDARQVDAVIGEEAPFNYYLRKYPDQHIRMIRSPNLPVENFAFAVKKGNAELLNSLNKGLAEVKADGTLDKLKHDWLDTAHVHSDSEKTH